MAELINQGYTDFTIETLTQPSGVERLNSILRQISTNIAGDTENVRVYQGYGTPEAAVAAGIGSLYLRLDGTTDTSVYRKESGSGDTGWVAIKAPASLPLSVANGGLGADNSSQVQGTIPYVSATGVVSFLGTGTSGYFLKTQGAGANPAWAVPTDTNSAPLLLNASIASTATTYYTSFGAQGNSTSDQHEIVVPIACTIKNLYIYTANTAANTIVVTVRKSGADTAVTATVATTATTANDTTHTVAFAAGDRIGVSMVNNRGVAFQIAIGVECQIP